MNRSPVGFLYYAVEADSLEYTGVVRDAQDFIHTPTNRVFSILYVLNCYR